MNDCFQFSVSTHDGIVALRKTLTHSAPSLATLPHLALKTLCLLVACLTSPNHSGCISGMDLLNFTSCHTERKVANQTFYLTPTQYTDTRLTCPNTNPITPGVWQSSHWSTSFYVTGMIQSGRRSMVQVGTEPRFATFQADAFTTRPMRPSS